MKKIIIGIIGFIIGMTALTTNAAIRTFVSEQVGTGPTPGYILQTNGSVSTWIATSSLPFLSTSTAATTYIPYTGATADVDLGTHNITSTGTANFGSVYSNSPTPFSTGGFQVTGKDSGTENYLALFVQDGVTPESTSLSSVGRKKALVVQGNGASYFVGRDVTNNIEMIFGTSDAGAVFMGSYTNHAVQIRTNNTTRVTVGTTGNTSVTGTFTAGGSISTTGGNLGIGNSSTVTNPYIYLYGYNTTTLTTELSTFQTSSNSTLNIISPATGGGIRLFPDGIGASKAWLDLNGYLTLGTSITTAKEKLYITSKDATVWERLAVLGTGTGTVGAGSYIEFASSISLGYGARIGGIRDGASGANAFIVQTGTNAQTTKFKVKDNGDTYINNAGIDISEATTVGGLGQTLLVRGTASKNALSVVNSVGGSIGGGVVAGTDDNAATANGDRLGYFAFAGAYDTTHDLKTSAGLFGYADGLWTSTSTPSYMYLATTPAGSVTRVNAVKIGSDKTVNFYGDVYKGTEQSIVVGNIFTQTADKTIANTTTETSLVGTGSGSTTLPANTLKAGTTLKVKARGYISGTNGHNATLRIKIGSTTLITSVASMPATITDAYFDIDLDITCRTAGASGTVIAQGKTTINAGVGLTTSYTRALQMTSTATIDTTASQTLDATYEWGTASVDNTITSTNLDVNIER